MLSSITSKKLSQRLCFPSSLSSAEPVLDDDSDAANDEPEESLVIPLVISSAALALFDANPVTSFTLSLAISIVVLMDSMLATIILFAILVPVTTLSVMVEIVLVYASAIADGKFVYGNQKFIILCIAGVHAD